jgi:hypothetical protein
MKWFIPPRFLFQMVHIHSENWSIVHFYFLRDEVRLRKSTIMARRNLWRCILKSLAVMLPYCLENPRERQREAGAHS